MTIKKGHKVKIKKSKGKEPLGDMSIFHFIQYKFQWNSPQNAKTGKGICMISNYIRGCGWQIRSQGIWRGQTSDLFLRKEKNKVVET